MKLNRMKPGFKSVKITYTVTLLLLVAIFAVAISTVWGALYKSQLWNSTANYANQMMKSSSDNFDKMLSDINYSMTALEFNDEFKRILLADNETPQQMIANRRTMDSLLRSVMTNNSSVKDISLFPKNKSDFSTGSYYRKTQDEINSYFELAREKNSTVFLASSDMKAADNAAMNLAMIRLLNRNQKSEALMIVTINCATLLRPYEVKRDFEYGFLLYDRDTRRIMYQSGLDKIKFQIDAHTLQQPSNSTPDKTYVLRKQHEEEFMLMHYVSPLTDWETIVVIPQSSLLGSYMDASKISMVIIALCLLSAFVAAIITANALTGNIQKLCRLVEKINGDNLEIDAVIHSNDEIGLLYNKFEAMVERMKLQMQTIKREEKEKRKLEIKALQSQINPHFLYNSLSTIKFMAGMRDAGNIMEATEALSNIMSINMAKSEYMTFEQEENYLRSYICLKEYQLARPIRFTCEIDEDIRKNLILKLLLQPIVENSIKHGGILEKSEGYVSVRAYRLNNAVRVVVKDNGVGMSGEKLAGVLGDLEHSKSIGLYNVISRVRLNYGEEYGVTASSEKNLYTMVEMTLPIISEADLEVIQSC